LECPRRPGRETACRDRCRVPSTVRNLDVAESRPGRLGAKSGFGLKPAMGVRCLLRMGGHYDEFDDLAVLMGETHAYRLSRSCEESLDVARQLSTVFGPQVPVIDEYLRALSSAPHAHLRLLARRGTRIVFAPTIDAVMTSSWAAQRRGRRRTWKEERQDRIDFGPESGAAAVYDSSLNALIFPTGYRQKDLKRAVLHELGHALTMSRAQIRPALIRGLPRPIQRHLAFYTADSPEETLRQRVLEALAEGYIFLVEGRSDELPGPLTSELTFMLQTVEDGENVRFEFQTTPDGERTATRAVKREIIDATHPEHADAFADLRLDRDAEPWNLLDDELSARRRRRRAA
jgi:hypothetical protein